MDLGGNPADPTRNLVDPAPNPGNPRRMWPSKEEWLLGSLIASIGIGFLLHFELGDDSYGREASR